MGLGSIRLVTLEQAKEKVKEAHSIIAQGLDPLDLSKTKGEIQSGVSFEAVVDAYYDVVSKDWRDPHYKKQFLREMRNLTYPTIGSLPVQSVDVASILQILAPIWKDRPNKADRIRGHIERVLDWASAQGHRTGDNPARWRGLLDRHFIKASVISEYRRKKRREAALGRAALAVLTEMGLREIIEEKLDANFEF